MALGDLIEPSPNYSAAPRNERLGVVFHHSGLTFEETIPFLLRPDSRASYHCLIAPDGTCCTLVADRHLAWHTGPECTFLEKPRCNEFTLGLAFAGDTYATPLTKEQIGAALEWLEPRWTTYRWALNRMTDHRQVSRGAEDDLAPAEWSRLRAAIAARFMPQPRAGGWSRSPFAKDSEKKSWATDTIFP